MSAMGGKRTLPGHMAFRSSEVGCLDLKCLVADISNVNCRDLHPKGFVNVDDELHDARGLLGS
jgi:hypothetical protein